MSEHEFLEWLSEKHTDDLWESVFRGDMLAKNVKTPLKHIAWRVSRMIAAAQEVIISSEPLSAIPQVSSSPPLLLSAPQDKSLPIEASLSPQEGSTDRFCELVGRVDDILGLSNGCPSNRVALEMVTDPERVAEVWPSLLEICRHEQDLILDGVDVLTKKGQVALRTHLKTQWGLSLEEILCLEAMIRLECRRQVPLDRETDRSVMVLRLEGLIARAQENLDLRVELMALNRMAQIQQLYEKPDSTDLDVEFTDVVFEQTSPIEDGSEDDK